MIRRTWIVVTVLVLVTTACSSGDSDGPTGMTRHDGPGYTLLLPSDWLVLTAGDPDLEALFASPDAAAGLTPEMSAQVDLAFAQGLYKLFAFDLDSAGRDFVNNLNLGALGPLDMTAAAVLDAEISSLRQSGAVDVSGEVVSFPAGDGYLMTYRMPVMGSLEAAAAGILGEDSYWIITMVAPDAGPYTDIVRQVAESFRERP